MLYKILGLLFIAFGILCLLADPSIGITVILIGIGLRLVGKFTQKHSSNTNEAQNWLNGYKASLDQETRMYHANKRERDRLLDEARSLEQQAKHSSFGQKKALKNQAEELRRQAGRL